MRGCVVVVVMIETPLSSKMVLFCSHQKGAHAFWGKRNGCPQNSGGSGVKDDRFGGDPSAQTKALRSAEAQIGRMARSLTPRGRDSPQLPNQWSAVRYSTRPKGRRTSGTEGAAAVPRELPRTAALAKPGITRSPGAARCRKP